MRILLCPSAYAPHIGGVEELTYRLAKEYQSSGHNVLVVTSRWPLDLQEEEVIKEVIVKRIDYVMPQRRLSAIARFPALFPVRIWTLIQIIKQFRPDVVHIQCVSVQGFYLLLLKKVLGFKLVVTLQGERRMDAQQVYQRSKLMEPMLSGLLRTADYVTACSKATLDDVCDLWPGVEKRKVVPNGISLNEFDLAEEDKIIIRPRSYLFATGRHVTIKGFDLLITAFSSIAGSYPDLDLVIGGDGPEHQALKGQIEEARLAERIILAGSLDRAQTVNYFRHCCFFILPSRYEPFGIVNLEAMAASKAVVAARVGGVAEIVEEGKTGLLVEPENPEALAAGITDLLENPELALVMGIEGRKLVAEKFDWKFIAKKFINVYEDILFRKVV